MTSVRPETEQPQSVRDIVVRGLRSSARFSGRDTRRQFWIYSGCVFGALFVPMQIVMVVALMPSFGTVPQPGTAPADIGPPPAFFAVLGLFIVALVLLLAAAVARRLHDTDRSGALGFLPLPFLGIGLIGMATLFDDFGGEPEAGDFGRFMLMFLNNVVYILALALLVWRLVSAGTDGPNHYGPPPTI